MTAMHLHPSEIAYAISQAKVADIVGWGRDPFLPGPETEDPEAWFKDGADRLAAAGRLIETEKGAQTFTPELTEAILALVNPALVLMAERKHNEGLRRLTIHVADDTLIGLTREQDGTFEVTRYADLAAASAAATGFLGTALDPAQAGARIDTDHETATTLHAQATSGQTDQAAATLQSLGLSEADATSMVNAIANPVAAGTLSALYCADNTALSAESYSVLTNQAGDTWIIFAPGAPDGPTVIEQSSASALAARVMICVAARMRLAA